MSEKSDRFQSEMPKPDSPPRPATPKAPRSPRDAPTVGSFFAEGRGLVDARKAHLARVGMTPEHATALAMPDLKEKPVAPLVSAEHLPEPNAAGFEPRKLPKLAGLDEPHRG